MRAILFVAVSIFSIFAVPAQAAWQYTNWGMSPTQVQKASKNAAVPIGDVEHDASVKLTAPYSTGSFKFNASFSFDESNKLDGVQLKLVQDDARELIGALHNKYGEPANDSSSPDGILKALLWRTKTDVISIMGVGDALTVSYRPRVGSDGKGL